MSPHTTDLCYLSASVYLPSLRAIVSKMASSEIDFMLERLKETCDPRFLLFLSNLCVCNDRPIPSTQSRTKLVGTWSIAWICMYSFHKMQYWRN